jgi:hypothetical protein
LGGFLLEVDQEMLIPGLSRKQAQLQAGHVPLVRTAFVMNWNSQILLEISMLLGFVIFPSYCLDGIITLIFAGNMVKILIATSHRICVASFRHISNPCVADRKI